MRNIVKFLEDLKATKEVTLEKFYKGIQYDEEFMPPVRKKKELAGTKTDLSVWDAILFPWHLQKPQLEAWCGGESR